MLLIFEADMLLASYFTSKTIGGNRIDKTEIESVQKWKSKAITYSEMFIKAY